MSSVYKTFFSIPEIFSQNLLSSFYCIIINLYNRLDIDLVFSIPILNSLNLYIYIFIRCLHLKLNSPKFTNLTFVSIFTLRA